MAIRAPDGANKKVSAAELEVVKVSLAKMRRIREAIIAIEANKCQLVVIEMGQGPQMRLLMLKLFS